MITYSRRDFLRITGISLAASQINIFPDFQHSWLQTTHQGRALEAAPVYSAPNSASDIIATLWPDSVSQILTGDETWYRLSNGYVERGAIQPMFVQEHTTNFPIPALPFWAEVVGPVAPIREYCAANAPLVTRIGHSGVAQMIDYLPGEPDGWYGISDDSNNLMGWTQAIHWLPIVETSLSEVKNTIRIDVATQTLSVEHRELITLQAPCSISPTTTTGTYALELHRPGGTYSAAESVFYGVPWQLNFGAGIKLIGAYWHNQFGKASQGLAIQVSPLLAQWLYRSLNTGDQLIIA
ncbi:MAG: L,D-transpeptidase [Chloroflexota bacterium]